MKRRTLLATAAALAISATCALAADDKPAIVFDIGGKFDKSFNESMYNGSEKFKADSGVQYGEFEIANEAQREQAIRNFRPKSSEPFGEEEAVQVLLSLSQLLEATGKLKLEIDDEEELHRLGEGEQP